MRSSAGFFSPRLAGRLAPVEPVATTQAELAGLLDRDVDVVAAGQQTVDPQEAVALVAQVQDAGDLDQLALPRLVGLATLVGAVAVATTATTTTTAALALGGLVAPGLLATCVVLATRRLGRGGGRRSVPPAVASAGGRCGACSVSTSVASRCRHRRGRHRRWCRRGRSGTSASPAAGGSLGIGPALASGGSLGIGCRRRLGRARSVAAGGRRVTPASSRIIVMMSAFLAREPGLPPRAWAIVASSARSLRSRPSRSIESTLTGSFPLRGRAARGCCGGGAGRHTR